MKNKSNFHLLLLFGFAFFLVVGYAVVNSVSLSITGTAAAVSSDLKVSFNGTKTVSNTTKGTATVTAGSKTATFTANNLTLNETIIFTYTVQNNETDVAADATLSITGNNSYFNATVSPTSMTVIPGGTAVVTVTVKMIKTPVSSTDNLASFTVNINATPRESAEIIKFTISSVEYQAEKGMTWAEWVDSDYNTIDAYVDPDGVVFYSYHMVSLDASDVIIANYEYYGMVCCFDPNMRVLMADGTYKKIIDVEVGDMVMSLDERTGVYIPQKVLATVIREKSDDLVYVNLSNGLRIGMRAYHPLLTTEGWKSLRPEQAETVMDVGKVEMLEVGDTLVGYYDDVTIVSIEIRKPIKNYNTYNLTIANTHNYIVEGVVVHNAFNCPL